MRSSVIGRMAVIMIRRAWLDRVINSRSPIELICSSVSLETLQGLLLESARHDITMSYLSQVTTRKQVFFFFQPEIL